MSREEEILKTLLADDRIQKALNYLKEKEFDFIEELIDLTCIEAPTFHEEKRSAAIQERFETIGLCNTGSDAAKNAIAFLNDDQEEPIILEAHMDTVFPFGTITKRPDIEIDGTIHCPGIGDNTVGVEAVLAVASAIRFAGIKPKNNILFAATAMEEGAGSAKGMRQLIKDHPHAKASISIDGGGFTDITRNATGVKTIEYTFHGKEGHIYFTFGNAAIVNHALGRAIAKIADIRVPLKDPRCWFGITNVHGGNREGMHSFPSNSSFIINFRSDDPIMMNTIDEQIETCVKEAVKEENERWGKTNELSYSKEVLCDLFAGKQEKDAPLVKANAAVIRSFKKEPIYSLGGCCNSNVPISLGIPAVCMGGGTEEDLRVHTTEEYFPTKDIYKTFQAALLLLLLASGTDKTESIFD